MFYIRAGSLLAAGPGAAAGWLREPPGLCVSREGAPRWGKDKNNEREHLPLGNVALVCRVCSSLGIPTPSWHYKKLCQGQLKHLCSGMLE